MGKVFVILEQVLTLGHDPRGLTLAETMVSLFFCVGFVLFTALLCHRWLQIQRLSERRSEALLLAESTLAQIKAWGTVPANFRSDWAYWQDRVVPSTGPWGLEAQVQVGATGRLLYSPCSSQEFSYGAQARTLNRALIPLRVRVAWGLRAGQEVRLLGYLGAPKYPLGPNPQVEVTQVSGGSPLPRDGEAQFAGRLLDGSGQVIEDLILHWHLVPLTGNASQPGGDPRSGQQATIRHRVRLASGLEAYLGGSLGVRGLVRYHGQWIGNGPLESNPLTQIELAP